VTRRIVPPGIRTLVIDEQTLQGIGPLHGIALATVLLRLGIEDAAQLIRIHSPAPTAAFTRRDSRRPGFRDAVTAARSAGFTPVLRGPGGRLAAYHRGSVVIDHIVRLPDERRGLDERFDFYARMHADVLTGLGLDARVGELPGEYCPGRFSINAGGVAKIVGSAQRVTRDGWLFSSIVQVQGSAALRDLLTPTHLALGYELDTSTVGTVEDFLPGTTTAAVSEDFRAAYTAETGGSLHGLPAQVLHAVDEAVAVMALPQAEHRLGHPRDSP
jgi:lipoate-protein ligase A